MSLDESGGLARRKLNASAQIVGYSHVSSPHLMESGMRFWFPDASSRVRAFHVTGPRGRGTATHQILVWTRYEAIHNLAYV